MQIDREGIFRTEARPACTVRFSTVPGSEATAVALTFTLTDELCGNEWAPLDHPYTAYGDLWVIKADGSDNVRAKETLSQVLHWNGDIDAVADGSYEFPAVQVTVKHELDDRGRDKYAVQWINALDYVPKRNQPPNADKLARFTEKYGAAMRAYFGNNGPPKRPRTAKATQDTPPHNSMTRSKAWQEFTKIVNADLSPGDTADAWGEIVDEVSSDNHSMPETAFTGAQWNAVLARARDMYVNDSPF